MRYFEKPPEVPDVDVTVFRRAEAIAAGWTDERSRWFRRVLQGSTPRVARPWHPVPQLEIFDGAEFVARVDLAFPEALVAVEHDGGWHADPAQIERDRTRRARLRELGWRILVVTNEELRNDVRGLVERVAAAVRAAKTPSR